MPKILYLLDGHAIAYRAYFALTSGGSTRWATSSGEPTAGVYGFASMLFRIFEQEQPDYLAVSFDKGKTFRHDLYKEYKGTRAKMPEDLRGQIERIREMVDRFNIPRIEVDNYEADDVIGSLAIWAEKEGLGVKIVTGDRDLLQLVTNRIVVALPNTKTNMNDDYFPEDVVKRMGVQPDQIVDYKALVGDTSDNIPGVRGIGEKTAISLISTYQNLDNIYAHVGEIKGSLQAKLQDGRESAYLSQDLARIRTDLDIKLDLQQAQTNHFNPEAVETLFRELEFRTLTQRLHALVGKLSPTMPTEPVLTQSPLFAESFAEPSKEPAQPAQTPPDIEAFIVDSPSKLNYAVEDLLRASIIAFDTETTSLDPMQTELVGISIASSPKNGYYFPIGHHNGNQLPLEAIKQALQPIFTSPTIAKVGHNAKYDMVVLKQNGILVSPLTFDTMIAEWLLNPDSRNKGLKTLAWVRLGVEMTHIEDLIGSGKKQKTMAQVAIEDAASYAVADAVMTLRLVTPLYQELKNHNAVHLMDDLEIKLVPILATMEENGILLDPKLFADFAKELEVQIEKLEDSIYLLAGESFNIGSTQQLADILFERLNLEPPVGSKKTSSGKMSTAAGVLEDLRGKHLIIDQVLEWRELTKLKSTYVDALPTQINPKDNRIHTSFNQTGTATGRIASQNPNVQNIPTRTDIGRRVRNGFIASEGNKLVAIDYSQIELRILAHVGQDQAMLQAFHAGQDIHVATAAAILDIPLDQVTKAQRRHAKAINFGLMYGMSPFGLTRTTDLTLAEAENFVKAYFLKFPSVKAWLDDTRKQAAEQGFVETLLGRRRYFPNLKSGTNYIMKQREEREAINAPIQGTAADIIKIAMIQLPAALTRAGLKAKMLLQVHDELIFEVPEEEVKQTIHVAKAIMENALKLDVPLTTEARVGQNWGELEPIEDAFGFTPEG